MNEETMRKVRTFNARCLATILGKEKADEKARLAKKQKQKNGGDGERGKEGSKRKKVELGRGVANKL